MEDKLLAKVKELVKSAKDQAWKFGDGLEEAGQSRNKKFWSTIKNIRRGGVKESWGSVLDEEGRLITGEKNVSGRWKEYFQDLFKIFYVFEWRTVDGEGSFINY